MLYLLMTFCRGEYLRLIFRCAHSACLLRRSFQKIMGGVIPVQIPLTSVWWWQGRVLHARMGVVQRPMHKIRERCFAKGKRSVNQQFAICLCFVSSYDVKGFMYSLVTYCTRRPSLTAPCLVLAHNCKAKKCLCRLSELSFTGPCLSLDEVVYDVACSHCLEIQITASFQHSIPDLSGLSLAMGSGRAVNLAWLSCIM